MQLNQVRNIHTSLWIHFGDKSWQESLDNKLGVTLYTFIHGNILIVTQSIKVEVNNVVENVAEAPNEVFQQLRGVDTEHIIHELDGHQTEVDGGVAEVNDTIMD